MNTATSCKATYTVDADLMLKCIVPVERHFNNLLGELIHIGTAYGSEWTWKDRESD